MIGTSVKCLRTILKLLSLPACVLITLFVVSRIISLVTQNGKQIQSTINHTTANLTPVLKPQASAVISLNGLQIQDNPQQLIDMYNFKYLMTQPPCGDHIAALILVHSAPKNFKKRQLIRETWGQWALLQDTPLHLAFLLGNMANRTLKHMLEEENIKHKDIVQGNFMDCYKNMTYKHAMAFKWFLYNCAQAQILIKTDDDIFLNTPQVLKYLKDGAKNPSPKEINSNKTLRETVNGKPQKIAKEGFVASQELFHHPEQLLFCEQMPRSHVKRSYRSKWRISVKDYQPRYFPPYCSGYSIIYSPDVLLRLYSKMRYVTYFWIDDVHVTGTVAYLLNITYTSAVPYVLTSAKCHDLLEGTATLSDVEFLFVWPYISKEEIRKLWQLTQLHYGLLGN